GEVHALEYIAGLLAPLPLEQAAGQIALEQNVIAKGFCAARNQAVIRLQQLIERKIPHGISRMRKEPTTRNVNRIDAGSFEPLANLHRVVDGVARRLT